MIPYILHVSILIAAGVLFYRLALKRLTFYVLNRWVLLSCLVAAFLLPLLPVPRVLSWRAREAARPEATVVETAAKPSTSAIVETAVAHPKTIVEQETIAQQEAIAKPAAAAGSAATAKPATTVRPEPSARPDVTADSKSPVASGNTARLLFYLYLSGVVILGLNLLRQMILLLLQRYKGPVIRDGHYRIVTRAGMQGPCSFGNIIFIHPSEYDPETYQQILLHEKIHAGGWHTLDILLAELGIIFQWFNPFIWLFRRELENNLEFLTDRNVLRYPGVERAAYQLSLVKVAAPDASVNITSNYNQSLLKRRIIMMNAQNSSRHTAWKYFFLLPLFVVLAGVLNRPAALAQTVKEQPSSPAKPKKPSAAEKPATAPTVTVTTAPEVAIQVTPVVPSVNVTVPVAPSISVSVSDTSKPSWVDRTEGAWFIVTNQDKDKKDDKVTIELRGENDDHNWNSSFSVPRSQLTSLNTVGKVEFSLTREAGTIHFTGQFDGEKGFGHYKFQPDAAYLDHMRQKKLVEKEDELMTFFMLDIKKSYVDMLQTNGFPDISKGHLISMAALHVDEDYIKSIRGSGYNDISESQLITFKAMKIDGDYLRKFPPSTPAHDIVTYRSLHIDSAYVASLKKAGYPDLSSRDIVSLKSMNVDGSYIKGFNDIGYKDIPVHMLISFKSMGITPEYVKSFLDVGCKDISRENLVSMKSMNITPDYVKSFLDLGYKDITPHHLTSLKAMNITPEFIKAFNAIGFKDIPLNQLSSLKAMGVTPDYVTKMKEKGFVSDDLNKYIRLKNAFD
ncbi:MAG: hypothetical protein BGO55_18910 [Sphingobacteriales bacterium 50-39]|nr:M56 family metallopeptidase [Sphingobacteriales bacterium]OJW55125.1 MAG: hypothetical protein BGO55_18910 [Sphingobacteriales bacterium 50-39]